jgi:hypothetical protein
MAASKKPCGAPHSLAWAGMRDRQHAEAGGAGRQHDRAGALVTGGGDRLPEGDGPPSATSIFHTSDRLEGAVGVNGDAARGMLAAGDWTEMVGATTGMMA